MNLIRLLILLAIAAVLIRFLLPARTPAAPEKPRPPRSLPPARDREGGEGGGGAT